MRTATVLVTRNRDRWHARVGEVEAYGPTASCAARAAGSLAFGVPEERIGIEVSDTVWGTPRQVLVVSVREPAPATRHWELIPWALFFAVLAAAAGYIIARGGGR